MLIVDGSTATTPLGTRVVELPPDFAAVLQALGRAGSELVAQTAPPIPAGSTSHLATAARKRCDTQTRRC
ncbi:hypothetical protein I553_3914 [Mycobacterium xenopi 4042]|uniref:Uncharacterized protein n=1 Tax=Mycobacterium xenopi 4042 TaxID=1299334 RepID=X8DDE4_MYCXE|nr:hypothetical protein I553_3914 [Mycobacterium xenopi 4042]